MMTTKNLYEVIKRLTYKNNNSYLLFTDLFDFCRMLGLNNSAILEDLLRKLEDEGLVAITTLNGDPDLIVGVSPMDELL